MLSNPTILVTLSAHSLPRVLSTFLNLRFLFFFFIQINNIFFDMLCKIIICIFFVSKY